MLDDIRLQWTGARFISRRAARPAGRRAGQRFSRFMTVASEPRSSRISFGPSGASARKAAVGALRRRPAASGRTDVGRRKAPRCRRNACRAHARARAGPGARADQQAVADARRAQDRPRAAAAGGLAHHLRGRRGGRTWLVQRHRRSHDFRGSGSPWSRDRTACAWQSEESAHPLRDVARPMRAHRALLRPLSPQPMRRRRRPPRPVDRVGCGMRPPVSARCSSVTAERCRPMK